jgi:hypothetical protein
MEEDGKDMGNKAIAKELGIARNTVRRYLRADGWVAYDASSRSGALAGLDEGLQGGAGESTAGPPEITQFFRPIVKGLMVRSASLLSGGRSLTPSASAQGLNRTGFAGDQTL